MILKNIYTTTFLAIAIAIGMVGCGADGNHPGFEYAPQMYHSVSYEPLIQITDSTAGLWLSNREDGKGEFFNSNPHNPYGMNMRIPAANTVRRNAPLPYRVHRDSIAYAARHVKSPIPATEAVLRDGQRLYDRFCSQCHGATGQGDGPVGLVFKGVPSYSVGRVAEVSEGHIFHTITYGRGRMGAHGSQLDIDERWKIVRYVQTLQTQN
jgi:mono/diheme cytochrome c family protein